MKVREIKVNNYVFRDQLGEFRFDDVKIIVPFDSKITPNNFKQDKDDYSISSQEIERMGHESAQRFFNENYKNILTGHRKFTPEEIYGICMALECNGSELAALLNIDKSTVSRILSGKHEIQPPIAALVMEKLKNEIDCPGSARQFLNSLDSDLKNEEKGIKELRIPTLLVAEWFIRKFQELQDPITNLKLQKLLYYAQGIALGQHNVKIFPDLIQAWEHGPVIRDIWNTYNSHGNSPLPTNPERSLTPVEETENVVKILEETVTIYGRLSAWTLRDKTHQEKPWLETKRNDIISDDLMKEFFSGVVG